MGLLNKKTAVSFTDMLKGSAVTKGEVKKKKNEAPQLKLDKKLDTLLETFLTNKEASKNAETVYREAELPLIEFARTEQTKRALTGDFQPTFALIGSKNTVKFITSDSFSVPQSAEVIEALKTELGDEFDRIIEEKPQVVLKDDVFTNPEKQAALATLLGEKFSDFFQTTITYAAKDGLNEKIYQLSGGSEEKLAKLRTFLQQRKPSLK